jgi:hypothetical protein
MIALTQIIALAPPPPPAHGARPGGDFALAADPHSSAAHAPRGHACRADGCTACGLCPRHATARVRRDAPPAGFFSGATAS